MRRSHMLINGKRQRFFCCTVCCCWGVAADALGKAMNATSSNNSNNNNMKTVSFCDKKFAAMPYWAPLEAPHQIKWHVAGLKKVRGKYFFD